ncbi:PREDICTED: uncharacterized protein LOC104724970 isoform X2 [Camelina sativa]|uniref:Uncharacterized protein LOC104724970 isoform X2 n=1 Tax=Camelina sativa TaxID=90675 RepID=A0ABM0UJ55_CAMSA|nr:PREDICTED: uncharacterized protein LOC104724970 isoform X2 [Camelina sativa]XP_010441921.1 PREDICTED: uncharacterized protein LOC104724970 isoform X2 [Camelina sativa]
MFLVALSIESTIPPSDKIVVASVQGEVEEIIPMKDMKLDWVPYIPFGKGDRQVDKMDSQIFILGCTQRRSDHVKKFNYYFPYIDNPFKENETEQSTVVQITFPSEPPVVCEYDWAVNNLEELTDDLIKKETLLMDQKDEFNVKSKEVL